jgi:hypothetical protein
MKWVAPTVLAKALAAGSFEDFEKVDRSIEELRIPRCRIQVGKPHRVMSIGYWKPHSTMEQRSPTWNNGLADHHRRNREASKKGFAIVERLRRTPNSSGIKVLMVLGRLSKVIQPMGEAQSNVLYPRRITCRQQGITIVRVCASATRDRRVRSDSRESH